jgi:ribosome-associated translation inhibitor RaiA
MKYEIHSEGFELTTSIRDYVRSDINEIRLAPEERANLSIYFKQEAPHFFSCTFKCHLWKRDMVIHETGPDLYTLISEARKALGRNIHKMKEKKKALIRRRAEKEEGYNV